MRAETSADVFAPPGEGELDQVIALFDCLRDNGVDLPEISVGDLLADPNGEELLDLLDPTDPDVRAGCARLPGPDPRLLIAADVRAGAACARTAWRSSRNTVAYRT